MSSEHIGAKRVYILGTIKVNAPLHIGSGEAVSHNDQDTDSPVKLNTDDKPYLPATAIGGLLRGMAENIVTALDGWSIEDVWNLFGEAPDKKSEYKKFHPSRLHIRHGKIKTDFDPDNIDIRDGIGIDRQRASARENALYNYEIVPPNQEFSLYIELRSDDPKDKELLILTLESIIQLPKGIGAKSSKGLGLLQLNIEKVVEINLTNKQNLFDFLSQIQQFDPNSDSIKGDSWEYWKKCNPVGGITLKDTKLPVCIPQAVTFTYRFKLEDPLLIKGQDSPEGALEDYGYRKKLDFDDQTKGIDSSWINLRKDPNDPSKCEPIVPGSSLRGVFRSHCERILRTLSWEYAKTREEYEKRVSASDPLERNGYLRSSGFQMQNKVKDLWNKRREGEEAQKRYDAGREIAERIYTNSDLGEQMWGSSQWASRVTVSEGYLSKTDFDEMIFQNVGINRFTGGASDQRLFNALALTDAVFEGKITVFGDEKWMLGLIALLFKDLHDSYVRIGSGKTRGRGKIEAWLTNVEVKAIQNSSIAESLKGENPDNQIWQVFCKSISQEKLTNFLGDNSEWLEKLLSEGVQELQDNVKGYIRYECKETAKGEVA